MQRITANHLALLDEKGAHDLCLSIYLNASEATESPPAARLERLVQESRRQLAGRTDMGSEEIEQLLKPVEGLGRNQEFWQHPSEGLAIYLSREFFVPFKLPYEVEETAILSQRFHLKPLLTSLTRNSQYYILAFSELGSRLFRADRFGSEEIKVMDMPPPASEIEEEMNKGSALAPGSVAAVALDLSSLMGNPSAEGRVARDLQQYASLVNKSVARTLNGRSEPMILAATEPAFHAYRSVNTYPTLLDTYIEGESASKRPNELQQASWQLIENQFDAEEQRAKKTLEAAVSLSGLATVEINAAIEASIQGRIETCIVPSDATLWGRFEDASETKVTVAEDSDPALCFDLYDYLAVKTIESGGNVIFAPANEIPGEAQMAALLKY